RPRRHAHDGRAPPRDADGRPADRADASARPRVRRGLGPLGVLRRVPPDLHPVGLVGDLEVERRLHVEVAHQAGGHEVLLAEVVVQARAAVAAEVPRGELALVAADELLALREAEVLLRDDHAGEARARPALAARAVAVTEGLGIRDLVLDLAAEAGSRERLTHL